MLQDTAISTIDYVRSKTDTCILMCSLGKDSIVLLDMIYPKFKKIYCVFMYFVKGLTHIERWINWLKYKYPDVEFVQIPHFSLTTVLKGGLLCVPHPNLRSLTLKHVIAGLKKRFGCDYVFLGMKKADGMNRRLMLKGYEKCNYVFNGQCYPLADYTQKHILSYMKHHNLPDPVRYSKKASSGVGFDMDCFLWLEEHFPEDLEKIYKVFPFSRRLLYEYHYKQQLKEENYGKEKIQGGEHTVSDEEEG